MPLPASLLGSKAHSLSLDPYSGPVTNTDAAGSATRPTTAEQLSRLGRRAGYRLDFHDPTGSALVRGHGLLRVITEVDLYRDAAASAAGLAFAHDDGLSAARLSSSLLAVHLAPFRAGRLGPGSFGILDRVVPMGKRPGYEADISFRTGAYVGSVSVSAADAAGLTSLAGALAARLHDRVAGVLAGSVSDGPVRLPAKPKAGPPPNGPDLSELALTLSDLGSGAVSHQGYQTDADLEPVSEYDRHMQPGGAFPILDSEVALFHSPTEASYTASFAIGGFGSPTEVKWVFGDRIAGVRITSVQSRPVSVNGGDEAKAVIVTIRLADGERLDIGFSAVRSGSTLELMTLFAPLGRPLSVSSLRSVVKVAAARLAGPRANVA